METDAEIAQPVIEPVVAAAKKLGLAVNEPVVLSAGANVVLHLTPSPVAQQPTAERLADWLTRPDVQTTLQIDGS